MLLATAHKRIKNVYFYDISLNFQMQNSLKRRIKSPFAEEEEKLCISIRFQLID
jgi:hypothetical protein